MSPVGHRRRSHRAVVALAVVGAIAMATAVAMLLLRSSPDAHRALLRVHTVRPWLIAMQLATLALAWLLWPRLVAGIARWLAFLPPQHEALLRARARIFTLLAIVELLIVLRAFIA